MPRSARGNRLKFDDLQEAWKAFNLDLENYYKHDRDKVFDSPMVLKRLKAKLQTIITVVENEESAAEAGQLTASFEYMLHERVLLHLLGYGKTNQPSGLLNLVLKFMVTLMVITKSQAVLI
jgi:hypothetical protein